MVAASAKPKPRAVPTAGTFHRAAPRTVADPLAEPAALASDRPWCRAVARESRGLGERIGDCPRRRPVEGSCGRDGSRLWLRRGGDHSGGDALGRDPFRSLRWDRLQRRDLSGRAVGAVIDVLRGYALRRAG